MMMFLQNFLQAQCEGRLVTMPTRSWLVEQAVEEFYQLQQHVETSSPTHSIAVQAVDRPQHGAEGKRWWWEAAVAVERSLKAKIRLRQ